MSNDLTVLPGSEYAMTCGVNLPQGGRTLNTIFKEELSDGLPITYLEKPYQNLKGTKAVALNETVYDSDSRLYKVVDDYQSSTSKSYKGNLSYGGLSVGAGIKLTNTVKSVTEDSRSFVIQNGHLIGYESVRTNTNLITEEFEEAYNNLPTELTGESFVQFKKFFESWGTHYVVKGQFGGFFSMTTFIDEENITRENSKKIESDVSAGFKANTDSGSFSTENAKETITKHNENLKNISIKYFSLGGGELSDLKAFLSSCRKSPVLMVSDSSSSTCEFEPLSSLIDNPIRKQAFDDALKKYAGYAYLKNGIIGSYTPIETKLQTRSDECQLILSTFYSESGYWQNTQGSISVKTPIDTSIVRSYASISGFEDRKHKYQNLVLSSGFTPYKSNDTYLADSDVGVGRAGGPEQVSAYKFGYPDLISLGDWKDQAKVGLDGEQIETIAEQDGFLSVTLTFPEELQSTGLLSSASVIVKVKSEDSNKYEDVSGTSIFYNPRSTDGRITASSCSLPVRVGDNIILAIESNQQNTSHDAFGVKVGWSFISIESDNLVYLGQPTKITDDVKVKAETDGFLSLYINSADYLNTTSEASAFCARTANELMTSEEMRRDPYKSLETTLVSALTQKASGANIIDFTKSSFLLPVPKGNWYTTNINSFSGSHRNDIPYSLLFYPLIPTR